MVVDHQNLPYSASRGASSKQDSRLIPLFLPPRLAAGKGLQRGVDGRRANSATARDLLDHPVKLITPRAAPDLQADRLLAPIPAGIPGVSLACDELEPPPRPCSLGLVEQGG